MLPNVVERMQKLLSEEIEGANLLPPGADARALDADIRGVVQTLKGDSFEGTVYRSRSRSPEDDEEFNFYFTLKGPYAGISISEYRGDLYLYVYPGDFEVEENGRKVRKGVYDEDIPDDADEKAWEQLKRQVEPKLSAVTQKHFGKPCRLGGSWEEWEVEIL